MLLLVVLALSACASGPETFASLRTNTEHGTFLVDVQYDEAVGYPVRFRCFAECSRPMTFAEPIADHPLGLFSRDQDELVFYLSSSGSAYQVHTWQITETGIKRVVSLSSRRRPDFLSDAEGHAVIDTYEGDSAVGTLSRIRWTYRDGAFRRSAAMSANDPLRTLRHPL